MKKDELGDERTERERERERGKKRGYSRYLSFPVDEQHGRVYYG